MYKVLVVDDEKNIRDRLANTFPWHEVGFRVIGAASDGLEALQFIREDPPHVVMTDIMMPEMDGLELAKKLQSAYPEIQTIILSAYDDFKYAQEAIRYGIKGYLLKPLVKDEFLGLLSGLAIELKKDEELESDRTKGVSGAREESVWIGLIKGELTYQNEAPRLRDYIRVIVCSFSKAFEKDLGLSTRQFIQDATTEYWKESEVPVLFYGNRLVLFAHHAKPLSKYDLQAQLTRYSDFLRSSLSEAFGKEYGFSIAVGNMVKDQADIHTSFNQAVYANAYTFSGDQHSIVYYQDISAPRERDESRLHEHVNSLMDQLAEAVLTRRKDDITHGLRGFMDALTQGNRLSLDEIQMAFSEFMLYLLLKAREKGISLPTLDKKAALEQIHGAESFGELKRWMAQTIDEILNAPEEERDGNRYVLLAKEHIHHHFSEKVTLEDLAGQLFIHPAYFSSIFKKETGQNFIDYVNEVRVQKAMELLKNPDYRIKDVSILAGFHNHSYFNKVFKKVTGMKPAVFRSIH
ncbi:DNA-binding response regulator [Paenibacillus sp. J23TS9]|uniref:response regulator n=1 Tax=Paenibacillus sp. J23TS9 TaxID=2807193 RepID=UPI001B0F1749|nr:response regulator [Paenibacillus sp. J23TS9]GIP27608.1 DNA-binding response regulator [Paenibacillus sp. J23TS9]